MTESAIRHLDTLPVDSDAEMSVLCWMLTEQFYRNDPMQGTAREFFYTENLRSDLFWTDRNKTIFREIERRIQAEPPEPIDALLMQSTFDDLPTRSLTVELSSPAYCASIQSAKHATDRLRNAYKLRQLATMGNRMLCEATNPESNPDAIIEGAETALSELHDMGRSRLVLYRDAINETLTEIEETKKKRMAGQVIGITSGLTELDKCLGGARKSQLITVAGRPGEGKSALALRWVDAAAESGHRVNFHSLEMDLVENIERHLAMRARVGHQKIRMGFIGQDDIAKISQSVGDISDYKIWLNTHLPQTIESIRGDIFRTKPDLVIVDYLQIINPSETRQQRLNRREEVSKMSRGLKTLAKEFRIPMIMLSQLNRDVERRQSREPQLSDLLETGTIEADSDVVVFIYREDPTITNQRTILVAKQRSGPLAKFNALFEGEYLRFDNLEQQSGDYYRDN